MLILVFSFVICMGLAFAVSRLRKWVGAGCIWLGFYVLLHGSSWIFAVVLLVVGVTGVITADDD